jgi:hypothetical protein
MVFELHPPLFVHYIESLHIAEERALEANLPTTLQTHCVNRDQYETLPGGQCIPVGVWGVLHGLCLKNSYNLPTNLWLGEEFPLHGGHLEKMALCWMYLVMHDH